ncbi:hypothetical protein BJ165DRAFT_991443 [Panaeolus papilionaceus]|nr:hypothetical protein BJ165DRAFT_991443 [Panaeolus papilionaceus]
MASATELITSVTEDESPRLPPELERIIFEMAAYDIVSKYPAANSAINLQLIAKHVQCWVQPIVYRVFAEMLDHDDMIPGFRTYRKYPTLKQKAGPLIKVFLCSTMQPGVGLWSLKDLLQHCPNIENLAMWCNSGALPALHTIISSFQHLKRFSANFEKMTREQMLDPVFHRLTHLEIFGDICWDILLELKNLTHLSVDVTINSRQAAKAMGVKSVLGLLCQSEENLLQVVKIIAYDTIKLVEDFRIVFLDSGLQYTSELQRDWIRGVNGELDSWEIANRVVYARKRTPFTLGLDSSNQPNQSLDHYMDYVPREVFRPDTFEYKRSLNEEGQNWWQSLP